MIEIFLSTIFLFVIFLGFGFLINQIFGEIWDGISGILISGIVATTVLFVCVAFVSPITPKIEIIAALIGLFCFFYFKGYAMTVNFLKTQDKYWIIPLFFTLFVASFSPYIMDHFGYYIPTINWLSQFKITKGIVNMDLALAQTSFWHILQTGFSHFIDSDLRINVIVALTYLIYLFEKKQWFLLIFYPLFYFFLQSPSPDLPILAFSILILNEILHFNKNNGNLLAVSIFLFCIKPTLIWLPIFALFNFFSVRNFDFKNLIPSIVIALLFIIKNYFTFGFPIIPVQYGDLNLAWKADPEILKMSSEIAIQKTYDMQYSMQQISKFSTLDYIVNWFTLKGLKSKINIILILLLLIFTGYSWIQKKPIIRLLWVSVIVKSILVLIFSAQYRFFLDVFLVIGFIFLQNISRKNSVLGFYILNFIICGILTFPRIIQKIIPSFLSVQMMNSFSFRQIIKPINYENNQYAKFRIGNLTFNVVKAYLFSFDIPAPAITPDHIQNMLKVKRFPQWIDGNDHSKGIYLKKISKKKSSR